MNIGLKYSWTNNQQLSGKNIYIEKKQSQRIGFSKLFFTTTHFFLSINNGDLAEIQILFITLGYSNDVEPLFLRRNLCFTILGLGLITEDCIFT